MMDLECVHINANKFTGSKTARHIFAIEYTPLPVGKHQETNQVIVLATDITEAALLPKIMGFREKIGNVKEIKDLGICIDMKLIPKENMGRFENIIQ
jgi:hypothetical protein